MANAHYDWSDHSATSRRGSFALPTFDSRNMPNPRGKNGSKPAPPENQLRTAVEHYVTRGFTNPEIVIKLRQRFNPNLYALSESLVKKKRAEWGLRSTRGQAHTLESIGPTIELIHDEFPTMGSRLMKVKLLREYKMAVSKKLILEYMNLHYRDEVLQRKGRRLRRKQFWTVGVNDLWSMDQHDKWRKFQLFLHIGVEPHSGLILWLKIWWTNRNPRLVCGWYLDTIQDLGYVMPLITQSDPGTENYGIANAQTILRHLQDASLQDTLQHKFRGNKGNIKPEIAWRRLRDVWAPGYETFLTEGVTQYWYDPDIPLHRLVFHYVFIPWLQSELDTYREEANDTKPRFNRNKVLPHGRPVEIFNHPTDYGTLDFGVHIDEGHVQDVRQQFAPPDHHVFRLVPPAFEARVQQFYNEHGGPPVVSRHNAWDTYLTLLAHFESIEDEADIQTIIQEERAAASSRDEGEGEERMALLPLKPYRPHTTGVVGHVAGAEDDDSEASSNEWTDASSAGSAVDPDSDFGSRADSDIDF